MKGILTLLAVSLLLLFTGCSDTGQNTLGPDTTDRTQSSISQTPTGAATDKITVDGDDEGDPWEDTRFGNDGETGPPSEDPGFRKSGGHQGDDKDHGPYYPDSLIVIP